MLESSDVKNSIDSHLLEFISRVRIRFADEAILLYVPREKIADKVSSGFTSMRQLKALKKKLKDKFSKEVEVYFVQSGAHYDLESGFYQLLKIRSKGKINAFFMSFDGQSSVDTWLEAVDLDEDSKLDLENYYEQVLAGAGFEKGAVTWINSGDGKPTDIAVLRVIKVMQPVELGGLLSALQDTYATVNDRWLKSKLDQLRKKKLIHWQHPDIYSLTLESLSAVPSGTMRSSSDISRALALGKRKW